MITTCLYFILAEDDYYVIVKYILTKYMHTLLSEY